MPGGQWHPREGGPAASGSPSPPSWGLSTAALLPEEGGRPPAGGRGEGEDEAGNGVQACGTGGEHAGVMHVQPVLLCSRPCHVLARPYAAS